MLKMENIVAMVIVIGMVMVESTPLRHLIRYQFLKRPSGGPI